MVLSLVAPLSEDCLLVNKRLYAINWSILFCGMINPLFCVPFPEIFLTIWKAPLEANPAEAEGKVFTTWQR